MDKLKKYREIYWNIGLPDQVVNRSWQDLRAKMNSRQFPAKYFRYPLAFLSLALVLSGLLVGLARAAAPGSALYPVRVLSDKIISNVTGKPEYKVEKRAEDVINVSEKESEDFKEASNEYQRALDEAAKEVQKDEVPKTEFKKSLDKQEEQFQQAILDNPNSADKLQKVMDNARQVREKLDDKENQKENQGKGNGRENRGKKELTPL